MGLLPADLRADFAATCLLGLEGNVTGLCARCEAWFADERIEMSARRVAFTVDMRYAGQNYELPGSGHLRRFGTGQAP